MAERQVFLHGALAKKYGKAPITVNADTTKMIFRGLFSILGHNFKETIRNGSFHIIKGKKKNKDSLGEDEVEFTLGKTLELHVMPVIKGHSGWYKVVIGVVLVVAGVVFANPYLVNAGAMLIVGGAADLLTPKPKLNSPSEQAGQNPSFMFNGAVNVTEQGGPVPIILGRVRRAGCVVLSAGLTLENLRV